MPLTNYSIAQKMEEMQNVYPKGCVKKPYLCIFLITFSFLSLSREILGDQTIALYIRKHLTNFHNDKINPEQYRFYHERNYIP